MQFLQSLLGGQMSLMGLIVFVLVTYFSGQYSAFMLKWRAPIIIAGAVLFFIILVIQKMMAKKSAAAIEDRLQAQAQEQMATARPDKKPQVEALQKQLSEAIASLKTSKMGAGALYSLPWYIIIGPPGSGKSTALQESGLNFPYMSQGRKGIRGVGGTRNCDWWFTDQGILLDTAGRYTTELEDRDEWLSFLDMLKKCRKRKPINGAIVCVSVADLIQCSDEEREGHVKNIRDRIDELTKRLEQIFPVYLLFTKCDLLNGFTDFFEDYGKSDRAQVWGFTLPYGGPKIESYQGVFDEEVRKLSSQLSAHRVASLATERPLDKKRRIFGFPLQFSMAHKKLADFVGELFRPNPFQESSILRGVYFTSGTQEGTPIDQLVSAMGGAFGLQEDAAGLLSQAVDRKSYFINTLFSKVIFGDQNLARSSTKVARRRGILRAGLAVASVLALMGFSISLIIAFFGNLSLMKSVGTTAKKLQEAGKSAPQDLAGNLKALEDLRVRIAELDGYTKTDLPMSLRWGLYRGEQVYLGEDGKSGIRKVYVDAINTMFLKHLGATLAREMTELKDNRKKKDKEYTRLFELLKVYQMIGKPLDEKKKIEPNKELIESVLRNEDRWLKTLGDSALGLPEESKKIAGDQRQFYVDQLVQGTKWKDISLPLIELDGKLIGDVIVDLRDGLWITESYQNIIAQAGDRFSTVTIERILGQTSGKDMFECPPEFTIPAAFTSDALDRYVRNAITEKGEILSGNYKELGVDKSPASIVATLTEMYETEYIRQWDAFFKNIKLVNFKDLDDASARLKELTKLPKDEANPFQKLFKGIWEGRAVVKAGKTSDDRLWLLDALSALDELQRGLAKILTTSKKGDRFLRMEAKELQDLATTLATCKEKIETSTRKADNALGDTAARVLNRSLISTHEAFVAEAQSEAEAYWKSNVYDFYASTIAGKYPLEAEAKEEVAMKSFSQFFNPKTGMLWKAVDRLNRLKDGFKYEGDSLVRFSREFDEGIRRAKIFRDSLYPSPTSEVMEQSLSLRFGRTTTVAEVILWVGEKRLSSADDPNETVSLIWSESAPKPVKVEIRSDVRGGDDAVQSFIDTFVKDDWGLLKLFTNATVMTDVRFSVTWRFEAKVSGTIVPRLVDCILEVQKKESPFAPKFFSDFKLPEKMNQ